METKEVKVVFNDGEEFVLKNDAPDIAGLVRTIVKMKDEIKPEEISIECDYEGFDKESFKAVLVDAINDFRQAISLDKEAYEAAKKGLEDLAKNEPNGS